MLEHLRAPFKKLIEPIAKALIAIGLTANAVTVIGAVGTIVVAIAAGVTGWLFGGAVVLTLLVLADSLDGSIAALTTGGTDRRRRGGRDDIVRHFICPCSCRISRL